MIVNGLRKNIINVTNIPWTVSRHELALYFSRFGCVIDAFVAFDKKTGLHQGHGHVAFLRRDHMKVALESKHSLEGKDLFVSNRK